MAAAFMEKLGVGGKKVGPERLLTVFEQMNAETADDIMNRDPNIAEHPVFNLFIGFVILLNSMMLGIEVDYGRGNALEDRLIYFIFDFLFFVVFSGEILLRIKHLGWDYFLDSWNFFDYILVVLNCADLAISLSSDGSGGLKIASAIRIIRLLRIVRNIKGLKLFYGLWIIIQGMLDSLRTMLWVAMLLLIIVYCLAITLTTLVGQTEYVKEHWLQSQQYVGTVYRSMWTVLQLITFDAWASDIARPLADVSPAGTVVLFATIVVCSFGVLNVIVAVMVERTLTIAKESKDMTGKVLEKTEQDLLKSMAQDFLESDLDASGELDYAEFTRLIATPNLAYKLRLLGIQSDEADSLFELMDADNSGKVSPEEFITGLQKLKGPAKGQDLVTLICFAQQQCLQASKFVERVQKLSAKAGIIKERLNTVGKGITYERRHRIHSEERNKFVWKQAEQRQKVIKGLDRERQLNFPGLKTNPF
jgi:voltage-gated sodium channel